MPSPIGHIIAGASVALAADQGQKMSRRWPYAIPLCALLAAAPDLDLLYPGAHRVMTHSLLAVLLILLTAMAVTFRRHGRVDWRVSMACALAYGTHLLADYFGVDPGKPAGIKLLWPWSHEWFISEWALFLATERANPLSAFALAVNTAALARELLVLAPIFLLFLLRRRRLARRSTLSAAPRDARETAGPVG
jgi:membrane-bound metal-dependent hydrolase YbcI (DUF457 family)